MITKKQLRQLLKKGLTGKEAAKLILQDSWEVDNMREGFLSMADIRAIQNSLVNGEIKELREYNKWVETYRIISFTLKEAEILALKILIALSEINHITESLAHSTDYLASVPAIVTQKQYDELLARRRERKLSERVSLLEAIAERAYWLATDEQKARISDFVPEAWIEEEPEVWRQASNELLAYILEKQPPIKLHPEHEQKAEALLARLRKDIHSLSDEEMDEMLQGYGLAVSHLYEAGFPEWVEHVDVYTPGGDEGDIDGMGIAIIQEPEPWQVDERGYFKQDTLSNFFIFKGQSIKEHMATKGKDLEQVLAKGVRHQKGNIKGFKAFEVVIGAVSEMIDVDMTEGLRELYGRIEETVKIYRLYNKPVKYGSLSNIKLPAIDLDKLRPTPGSIRFLKERMEISLGEGWHEGQKAGPKLAEMIEALEFPVDSDEWEEPEAQEAAHV